MAQTNWFKNIYAQKNISPNIEGQNGPKHIGLYNFEPKECVSKCILGGYKNWAHPAQKLAWNLQCNIQCKEYTFDPNLIDIHKAIFKHNRAHLLIEHIYTPNMTISINPMLSYHGPKHVSQSHTYTYTPRRQPDCIGSFSSSKERKGFSELRTNTNVAVSPTLLYSLPYISAWHILSRKLTSLWNSLPWMCSHSPVNTTKCPRGIYNS